MQALLLWAALVLSGPTASAIEVPPVVPEHQLVRCRLNDPDAKSVTWLVFPEAADVDEDPDFEMQFVGPANQYTVIAIVLRKDNSIGQVRAKVTIGEPKPPVPPTPDPPPVPPSPAPIPASGFRVLIIEETADRSKLPTSQQSALSSTAIRGYLNSKCAKGPDGKTPEWRQLDDDTPMDTASQNWRDAMNLPRTSLPWIVVSNGKEGESRPLPLTEAETLTLLKKYSGD